MSVNVRRLVRTERVRIRKERIRRGRKVCNALKIWAIRLSVIDAPQWAIDRMFKELPHANGLIWLRSGDARAIIQLDKAAGGDPEVTVMEYRRCNFCKRLLLDSDAAARRKLDQSWLGEWTGCGPGCSQIGWAKKGIRCE